MDTEEWEALFSSIARSMRLPGKTLEECGQEVHDQAKQRGRLQVLANFVAALYVLVD